MLSTVQRFRESANISDTETDSEVEEPPEKKQKQEKAMSSKEVPVEEASTKDNASYQGEYKSGKQTSEQQAPIHSTYIEDWETYGKITKNEATIDFEPHEDLPGEISEKLFSTVLSMLRHNKPQYMGPRSDYWIPFMRLHSNLVLTKDDIEPAVLWNALRTKYHNNKGKWFMEFASADV